MVLSSHIFYIISKKYKENPSISQDKPKAAVKFILAFKNTDIL